MVTVISFNRPASIVRNDKSVIIPHFKNTNGLPETNRYLPSVVGCIFKPLESRAIIEEESLCAKGMVRKKKTDIWCILPSIIKLVCQVLSWKKFKL